MIFNVSLTERLDALKVRGKKPLIYHQANISNTYASINVQFGGDEDALVNSRVVIFGRHNKMPTLKDCDIVKVLQNVKTRDGNELST